MVAILILVDFPLQSDNDETFMKWNSSRNPYFSGFSLAITCCQQAIAYQIFVAILILVDFPLQYRQVQDLYYS